MEIKIKCTASHFFELDELIVIQGNLKELSTENYEKLKKNILKHGFISPIHIWFNKEKNVNEILDGTQRLRTCQKMREEGIKIPKLPVTIIEAENEKEAREILLSLVSQYGKLSDEGLYEFLETSQIDFDVVKEDLVLDYKGIELERFEENFYQDKNEDVDPNEKELDENLKTDNTCPSCGYVW